MVIFAALGALDRIFGSRFGLGEKFEEGIMAIGALSISMVGIIALAPVIAIFKPVIVLCSALGLTRHVCRFYSGERYGRRASGTGTGIK